MPFKNLRDFQGFIIESVKAEIYLRYRGSFFGVLWSLMNPTLQAIVIFFVFKEVFRLEYLGSQAYFPYVYSGVLIAHFFTHTITMAGEQVFIRTGLLVQTAIPLEVFVTITALGNTINFMFGLVPLGFFVLLTGGDISFKLLLLPFLIVTMLSWIFSLGLFLNSLYMKFIDLRFLFPVLFGLLIYLTPVYYDLGSIKGLAGSVIKLNPLTILLSDFRFTIGMNPQIDPKASVLIVIFGFLMTLLSIRKSSNIKNRLWEIR